MLLSILYTLGFSVKIRNTDKMKLLTGKSQSLKSTTTATMEYLDQRNEFAETKGMFTVSLTLNPDRVFVGPLWRVRPRIPNLVVLVVVVVVRTVRSEIEYCTFIHFRCFTDP